VALAVAEEGVVVVVVVLVIWSVWVQGVAVAQQVFH